MQPYLILFAHGARDPEWARPLQRLRESILAAGATCTVQLAFLEFMQPSLAEALDEAAAAGVLQVQVVPVFLAQGGHVRRDVPVILEAARLRHPQLQISLMPVIGESPSVIEAMARVVLAGASDSAPASGPVVF